MTDVNEQSFSAGSNPDSVVAGLRKPIRQRIAAPTWRFRPAPSVVRTITTQIIPRIVLALRSLPVAKNTEPATGHSASAAFAALVLASDEAPAFAHIDALLASGTSVESIFLDLLAPTARRLGEQWENDATDFASVTLGVSRLQRIMRRLGDSFFNETRGTGGGESVLLTVIPGEQHSFGLSMVAEFFRRAGWNLCTGPFASHQELTSLVQNHWFDVIGFSVSSDRRLDELKKDIGAIRRDSRNARVGIMLGGPMVVAEPALVASMGADMMCADAVSAPQLARNLIAQMSSG